MLATTVNAPADVAVERRAERYEARHTLWSESGLRRVRSCGRSVVSKDEAVRVMVTTDAAGKRSAGYGGLQSCGSVWACPVCSAKIAAHRQGEIERALKAWTDRGGRVALGTFTMRHRKGQSLRRLWDALAGSWHTVTSGRQWRQDQDRYGAGRLPMIRVFEATEGRHGWHVHIHALILLPGSATDAQVGNLEARMFGRWSAALVRRGLSATRRHGADLKLLKGDPSVALGEYFTKAVYSASMEAARGDMKHARHGNRTPFGILADLVRDGDADDLDAWHEWERASKGRRQIAWTRGLRAELLTEPEKSDEDLAAEEAGGETETSIDGALWRVVQAQRADFAVLRAFEESRRAGLAYLMALSPVADEEDASRWREAKARGVPKGRRF